MQIIKLQYRQISILVFALSLTCQALAQSQIKEPTSNNEVISVSSSRPLGDAVHSLQSRFGWLISYEEPKLEYVVDLEDISPRVSKNYEKTKSDPSKQLLVPRSRSIDLTFDAKATSDTEEQKRVLEQLVAEYAKDGGPQFTVRESKGMLNVIPLTVKDKAGNLQPAASLLDAQISAPEGTITTGEFLQKFCDEVRVATGEDLYPGTLPRNIIGKSNLPSASTMSAREVLQEFMTGIAKPGQRLSWSLYYQYGLGHVLNIDAVPTMNNDTPPKQVLNKPSRGIPIKKQPGMTIRSRTP